MSDQHTPTILIVEDDPATRRLYKFLLTNGGYAVLEAEDGVAALEQLAHTPCDLVITDMHMLHMNGMELIQAIRRNYGSIYVILITAVGTPDTERLAMSLGANDYLSKPFDFEDLERRVRRFFQERGPDLRHADHQRPLAAGVATSPMQENRQKPPDLLAAHVASTALVKVYPRAGPWGRALGWWRAAAELAPALPLGLAADLGALLGDRPTTTKDGRIEYAPTTSDAYIAFLHAATETLAVRTARMHGLSDLAVAALLAHLAQGAPVPPEYRLPPGARPADVAAELATALASATPVPLDSSLATYHSSLVDHLLARLRALTPADIRFLHELGAGALGAADLADLRALTELLTLPPLEHALLDEVLAFLPALAETRPGDASQSYAVDGFSGLAHRGSLDAVLPSEWALPDVLLAYRFHNRELLYYGHERPPEHRPTLLLLLVQGGDAMAGDADLLARASALALARAAAGRGAVVQVAWFDTTLHAPQGLARPHEIATFVQRQMHGGVDLARVLATVQAHVQAQATAYARIEVQWLLHAQVGAEQVGALGALARRLRTRAGSSALFLNAGAPEERPALAEVLAPHWAALGSDVLQDAEARARGASVARAGAPH